MSKQTTIEMIPVSDQDPSIQKVEDPKRSTRDHKSHVARKHFRILQDELKNEAHLDKCAYPAARTM